MKPTERYLRSATRGLWGRAKQELRQELEGHLQVRIQEWRLGGLTEAEAERQTLRELGAPEEVRTGMLGIHTMPVLSKGGLAALLAATLLIGTLPHSQAQVTSIFGSVGHSGASVYLDFTQLQQEVQTGGVQLTGTPQEATLTVPDAPRSTFPVYSWGGSLFRKEGRTYIHASAILGALFNTGVDVQLSGWRDPTIQAGKATIRLRTNDWRVSNSLYASTISGDWELNNGAMINVVEPGAESQEVTLKGDFQEGQVYAIVLPSFGKWYETSPSGTKGEEGTIVMNVTTNVAQKGQVTLRISKETQYFKAVASVNEMQLALDPYREAGTTVSWSREHPALGVVLALTGRFGSGHDGYTVVPPAHFQQR